MNTLPLKESHYVAIVDDDDYAWATPFRWTLICTRGKTYARARIDGRHVYLHRAVGRACNTYDFRGGCATSLPGVALLA
jgi:hypothetical protein